MKQVVAVILIDNWGKHWVELRLLENGHSRNNVVQLLIEGDLQMVVVLWYQRHDLSVDRASQLGHGYHFRFSREHWRCWQVCCNDETGVVEDVSEARAEDHYVLDSRVLNQCWSIDRTQIEIRWVNDLLRVWVRKRHHSLESNVKSYVFRCGQDRGRDNDLRLTDLFEGKPVLSYPDSHQSLRIEMSSLYWEGVLCSS
jgi:hypothetical protein